MVLKINLPDDTGALLERKAAGEGLSAEEFVAQAVQKAIEDTPRMHIADELRAIWANVPKEELATLPVDGSYNLDHYLYGHPKKES